MRRGFERALDECLSQLNTGEFGLGEVLAHYPEYEAELRPLLRMAMLVRQSPQVAPSAEAKAAGKRRLLAAVAKKRREKPLVRPSLLRRLGQSATTLLQPLVQPQRQPLRLAQAIAALLVVVSLVGAGTVGVAADSLPDSPLYPIKLATERVQLALTTTAAGQARLHMDYSEKRLDEAQALAEAGKGLNEATLQAMGSERSGALTAIDRVSEEERLNLLDDFDLLTERQQVLLEGIKAGVPPSDQGAVEEALKAVEEHQSVATQLLLTPTSPRPTATAAPVDAGKPAAPVPPTFTPIPVPTATPVPSTFTPIPVPTATPVPPTSTPIPVPTATPVPTAMETPQAEVTFEPTVEPTATDTPQADVPFTPAVEATATPTLTATPTPTATSTPTPTLTPMPTPTPMPTVEPTTAPTPQAAVPEFPAGIGTV